MLFDDSAVFPSAVFPLGADKTVIHPTASVAAQQAAPAFPAPLSDYPAAPAASAAPAAPARPFRRQMPTSLQNMSSFKERQAAEGNAPKAEEENK